jgi:hypothetical protein
MRFKLGNLEYRVRWEFTHNQKVGKKRRRQTTTAILEVKAAGTWCETTRGHSHCNPKDRFDRVLGQRKALADALGPWPKEDPRYDNHMPAVHRAIIWQEFERIRANAQEQQITTLRAALAKNRRMSEEGLERLLQDVVNETPPKVEARIGRAPDGAQTLEEGIRTGEEQPGIPETEHSLLEHLAAAIEGAGYTVVPVEVQSLSVETADFTQALADAEADELAKKDEVKDDDIPF